MRGRDIPGHTMNLEPHRPTDHERVIALLKEVQAPPADAETPAIPDELIERLRGQYGRAPRRAILEDKPSFLASLLALFAQPKFAFATVLVLLGGITVFTLRSPTQQGDEVMRGGQVRSVTLPTYWLQSDKAEPAPVGLGMPTFIVLTPRDSVPAKGAALVFDPMHREARIVHDGIHDAPISIADPTDNDEWLTVHRQLLQQLNARR